MSASSSRRQKRQQRQQADRRRSNLIWGLVLIVVLALFAFLVWNPARPAEGIAVPTAEGVHIPTDTDPGEYNSNPPTSGPHYDEPLPAGFYEESDLEAWGPYPVAHAVHNLEHGYIIFWYNCDVISQSECDSLKAQIRDYLDSSAVSKLVAFPWHDSDVSLVLTSWGYMLEMPEFDAGAASAFINANRLKAPEPNAQ